MLADATFCCGQHHRQAYQYSDGGAAAKARQGGAGGPDSGDPVAA